MPEPRIEIAAPKLDSLFGDDTINAIPAEDGVVAKYVPFELTYIHPQCPYSIPDSEDIQREVENIKLTGEVDPIFGRLMEDGRYEVFAGLRTRKACELAGVTEVPVIIRDYDDNTTIIKMVDSELRLSDTPLIEKARAIKMRVEAFERKGGRPSKENSGTEFRGFETVDIVGKEVGYTGRHVRDLMHLPDLVPELQEMLGQQLSIKPAAKIATLPADIQKNIAEQLELDDRKPNTSQAHRLVQEHTAGTLTDDKLMKILSEEKPQEKMQIVITADTVEKYFPKEYTPRKIEETIIMLLERWKKEQERKKDFFKGDAR